MLCVMWRTHDGNGQREEVPEQDQADVDEQLFDDVTIRQIQLEDRTRRLDAGDTGIQLPALPAPSSSLAFLMRGQACFLVILIVIRAHHVQLPSFHRRGRQIGCVRVLGRQGLLFVPFGRSCISSPHTFIPPLRGALLYRSKGPR